jgi:hypothetical protein
MDLDQLGPDAQGWVREALGYLNFSSGAAAPSFLRAVNGLFGQLAAVQADSAEPVWQRLRGVLQSGLRGLQDQGEAFRDVQQAEAVLRLVFEIVLPGYRQQHRDLLFHQSDETLFQPFFLGRVCEAVLAEGGPWDQTERILRGALLRLNDFIGHRPVGVLRTAQKIQPYAHEKVRPIPLFIREAGVAAGRHHDVVQQALVILRSTDRDLLQQAWFDPELLDELALDPRAYDFDHPVNRRPNYHFGTWDPHHIDRRGYFRRYVVQEVTLEALWNRVEARGELPYEEMLFEAAAVLAGTILMGSAVTGDRPEAHDSATTLSTLVPRIAAYRDAFYERLLKGMQGPHGDRLRREARTLKQPFGAARQHLNQALARRRAKQLQHVHLARLFAQMGYAEAALRQAHVVPVASARMRCEIDCRIAAAHLTIDRKDLASAASRLPEIEDLLHRAIECGAFVDPWSILGFGGQFSKFPAVEDSAHDERIDELIDLLNEVFVLYARLLREATVAGEEEFSKGLSQDLAKLARWWDQFASTEVSEVEGFSGRESWESAVQVAEALGAWHRAGTAAGNVAFWREHAEQFHSPQAYAALVEALLDHHDLIASMALLVHWLSQAEGIRLAEGSASFHALALRWMERLWAEPAPLPGTLPPERRWPVARKFLDYLEANAEEFWNVPRLELELSPGEAEEGGSEESPGEDAEDLFSAAYENVVYRDTTDDGFEGELLEGGSQPTDFELSREAERLSDRLAFLTTIARLWKLSAVNSASPPETAADRDAVLAGWLSQATERRRQLGEVLTAVHRYSIPAPRGTYDALVEFDRRRQIKEVLLDRIIAAAVEMADTAGILQATMRRNDAPAAGDAWEAAVRETFRAAFHGDREAVRTACPGLFRLLARLPLLYLPTSRGGNPHRVLHARNLQQVLRRLLVYLPRLGLLDETYRLVETIRRMERNHPAGPMAITEFDRLFELAWKGMVQCAARSAEAWPAPAPAASARPRSRRAPSPLLAVLQEMTALVLRRWLDHSRHVRLSVLESVAEESRWQSVKKFIERYGHELFTQKFMTYGNLRAILHQGADAYLRSLEEEPEAESPLRLLEDLGTRLPREEAVRWLELCLEALLENYSEYLDYNSTTTQSDRGELLYILLDFLRLKAGYDRVAWHLQPLILAHEVLVRCGRTEAAEQWRQAVAKESRAVADYHLQRLQQLNARYGIRLRSVADRLGERFVQPLAVERLCALVRPAVEELRRGGPTRSFAELEREVARFTENPEGVGFDLPAWLEALEDEVYRVRSEAPADEELALASPPIPQVGITLDEIRRQIEKWDKK